MELFTSHWGTLAFLGREPFLALSQSPIERHIVAEFTNTHYISIAKITICRGKPSFLRQVYSFCNSTQFKKYQAMQRHFLELISKSDRQVFFEKRDPPCGLFFVVVFLSAMWIVDGRRKAFKWTSCYLEWWECNGYNILIIFNISDHNMETWSGLNLFTFRNLIIVMTVSYTHLTLPTIYSV